MVTSRKQHSAQEPVKQGFQRGAREPNKIGASTPYDFASKNLTAYGGLLPVAAMLEKLQFQQVVEQTLAVKRRTRAMSMYQFVLAMVLAVYVGFSRLNHLRFLQREPMLSGILKVLRLPPQCTFWRFLASLHLGLARQLLEVQRLMRQRVWEAANVRLTAVTLDTDTTVHTLFGNQMGGRKSYNPKNKGKKSYQPMLTFLAETRGSTSAANCATGIGPAAARLRVISRTSARRCRRACARSTPAPIPASIVWQAIEAYQTRGCRFVVAARKTVRLVEQLQAADWKPSRRTDADEECEFWYQPQGWGAACRFVALRYENKPAARETGEPNQLAWTGVWTSTAEGHWLRKRSTAFLPR